MTVKQTWITGMKRDGRVIQQQTNKRSFYFGFLLTGPAGAAINNLVQSLTWDRVPGGDVLAGFDAESSFPLTPVSPRLLLSSP